MKMKEGMCKYARCIRTKIMQIARKLYIYMHSRVCKDLAIIRSCNRASVHVYILRYNGTFIIFFFFCSALSFFFSLSIHSPIYLSAGRYFSIRFSRRVENFLSPPASSVIANRIWYNRQTHMRTQKSVGRKKREDWKYWKHKNHGSREMMRRWGKDEARGGGGEGGRWSERGLANKGEGGGKGKVEDDGNISKIILCRGIEVRNL